MKLASAWLALSCIWSLATAQEDAVPGEEQRPAGQVSDAGRYLSPADAGVLERELGRLRGDDGIDLMVVILSTPPAGRPDVLAAELLERWGEGDTQSLILHVAGDLDGPWMVAGGRTIRLAGEVITREAILEVDRTVDAAGGERERLFVAVEEMGDLLQILAYRGRYHEERLRSVMVSHQLSETQRLLKQRVLIVGWVAAAVLLVLGVLLGAAYWTRFRAPLWFPATSWRLRLGAPYAGGNDALRQLEGGKRPG